MTEEQIRHRVKSAVAHVSGMEMAEISDTAHFVDDLGLDSLTVIEAAVQLDREFRVEGLSTDEEEPFTTVDEAVRFIQDRLNLQSI